jgi:hypothetical protein
MFLHAIASSSNVWLTQPPTQNVPGTFSQGVKWPKLKLIIYGIHLIN